MKTNATVGGARVSAVCVHDAAAYTQSLRDKMKSNQVIIFSSIFSPDGLHLVSCSDHGRIAFWNLNAFLVTPPFDSVPHSCLHNAKTMLCSDFYLFYLVSSPWLSISRIDLGAQSKTYWEDAQYRHPVRYVASSRLSSFGPGATYTSHFA